MFDLIVFAAAIGGGWLGVRRGLHWTLCVTLELTVAAIVAVVGHEVLAGYLAWVGELVAGPLLPRSVSVSAIGTMLAFALLLWGTFGLVRLQFHGKAADDVDPVTFAKVFEQVGSGALGAVGGLLAAACVLISLSTIPLPVFLKPAPDRMFVDVGRWLLRAGALFAWDEHEGWPLILHGEPLATAANPAARLTSEPWCDVDSDGTGSEGDRYRDVDGGGTFTRDLYYLDLDGDRVRRVGLVDKYAAGCWDASLMAESRERPDQQQPEASDVAAADAAAEAAAAPAAEGAESAEADPPAAGGEAIASTVRRPRGLPRRTGKKPAAKPTAGTPAKDPADDF